MPIIIEIHTHTHTYSHTHEHILTFIHTDSQPKTHLHSLHTHKDIGSSGLYGYKKKSLGTVFIYLFEAK